MTTSSQVLSSTFLRETLLTIPALTALLQWNGITKIFWEHVPQNVPLPYVVLSHMLGGEDNSAQSRATDETWKVVAHTGNMDATVDFINGIASLAGMLPVSTTYSELAIGYTTLEETMPIFDRYQVQNNPLFVVGGLYRIRLSIGAEA